MQSSINTATTVVGDPVAGATEVGDPVVGDPVAGAAVVGDTVLGTVAVEG